MSIWDPAARHPETSKEALARSSKAYEQSLWVPLVFILGGLAVVFLLSFVLDFNGGFFAMWIIAMGVALIFHLQALSVIYRESHHRLKAEGK